MIEGLLGKKIGMTRIFIDGMDVPVTVIEAGLCHVTQRKTQEKDGYNAVQLGFVEKKAEKESKAQRVHFEKGGNPCFYHVKEFKGGNLDSYKSGQKIGAAEIFKAGDYVDVTAKSKGKGFMGVMRRHHFGGGRESHGSMHNRAPGSIGSSSYPSRVFKGMRMGGHMGAKNSTIQSLKIVAVRDNILLIRGGVPGHVNAIVVIKKAEKKK